MTAFSFIVHKSKLSHSVEKELSSEFSKNTHISVLFKKYILLSGEAITLESLSVDQTYKLFSDNEEYQKLLLSIQLPECLRLTTSSGFRFIVVQDVMNSLSTLVAADR